MKFFIVTRSRHTSLMRTPILVGVALEALAAAGAVSREVFLPITRGLTAMRGAS